MSTTPSYLPEVEIVFEYDIPDKYLHQTNELGKKARFTYKGPEKIWAFVEADTGRLEVGMDARAYNPDNENEQRDIDLFAGKSHKAVLVDANEQPLLATLVWMDNEPHENYPCKAWRDPDTNEVLYWETDPLIPDDAYDQENIHYDLKTNAWIKPFPWEKPGMSEEQWEESRKATAWHVSEELRKDKELNDPANAAIRQKVVDHLNDLENLRTKFPKPEWDYWMIPFPKHPRGDILEGNKFEADEAIDPDRSKVDVNE